MDPVDYLLAPEHPAPAGVDDVVRALRWAADLLPVRTLLSTAEHDALRDEGQLPARELARGGTAVDYVPHPGHLHGFLTLDAVSPAARTARDALLVRYGAALAAVSGEAPGRRKGEGP